MMIEMVACAICGYRTLAEWWTCDECHPLPTPEMFQPKDDVVVDDEENECRHGNPKQSY